MKKNEKMDACRHPYLRYDNDALLLAVTMTTIRCNM